MMILPRVKNYQESDNRFVFKPNINYYCDNKKSLSYSLALLNYLEDIYERYNLLFIPAKKKAKADITITKISNCNPEYYEIKIDKDQILINYVDNLSLRNAISTIIALILVKDNTIYLKCCHIADYTHTKYRGFLIDIARKYIPIDELKMQIRLLALAKYNIIHFHLYDTERYAIKSEIVFEINRYPIFKKYSLSEMKDIVLYAKSFGIDIIPEIDFPAHSEFTLSVFEDMKCIKDGKNTGNWAVCISNEKTYTFLEKLVKELTKIFPYEYIHIGGDELTFYDMKDSGLWPNWDNCDRCNELSKKENLNDINQKFYYFIKRMYTIVKKYNKKLMIWNDAVDISLSPNIPKDILIMFWRIALKTRGPYKDCTMQKFLDEGFCVVNAFFEQTYTCDYINEEKLKKWNPLTEPEVDEKFYNQVIGGELCAWGVHNHFDFSLPSTIYCFADRLWNLDSLDNDKEINKALNRQIISHDVDFVNIFDILNLRIFPLNDYQKFFEDKLDLNLENIENAIYKLTRLHITGWTESKIIKSYIYVLQEARNMIRRDRNIPAPDTTIDAYLPSDYKD